jgi:murein DD-endopeptidase MepM/ murein hydrolase activator NlpD
MKKSIKIVIASLLGFLVSTSAVLAQGILTLSFKENLVEGSRFGASGYASHKGTDWLCPIGTVVLAAADGVVVAGTNDGGFVNADPNSSGNANDGNGYGNRIYIDHGVINGKTLQTHYAHLSTGTFLVKIGDSVKRGQPIALSGHNGFSTEPHFHLTTVINGVYVDPYNESSLSIDQYSLVDDNYLWTTNPPSHAGDQVSFTFDKALSNGFSTGWDTIASPLPEKDEWRVKVVNNPPHTNPGILSPVLSPGIMAKYTTIKIRAKVFGAIVKDPKETINPILWIRHKDGNWNHKVSMGSILKSDQSYRDYVVDLSSAVGPIFIDVLEVSQFSLELSDGDSGDNEYWYLDSVEIMPNTVIAGSNSTALAYSSPTPTGLRIGGLTTINENNSLNYDAILDYSDGTLRDVTNSVNWGIDCPVGSITYKGIFTASPTNSDTACKIKAVYNNFSASLNIQVKDTSPVNYSALQTIQIMDFPKNIIENSTTKVKVGGYYGGSELVDLTSLVSVSVASCSVASININKEFVAGIANSIYEECLLTASYNGKTDSLLVKVQTRDCKLNVPTIQYPTIQKGINTAFDGCVVMVAPGTYNENLFFNEKNISLISSAGAEKTIINGSFLTNGEKYGSTIVILKSGKIKPLIIDGFTITGGKGSWFSTLSGLGMYMSNSSPIIKNSIITENNSTSFYDARGGGIAMFEESQPIIDNCVISNNNLTRTGTRGAGVYSELSAPVISGSSFINNSSVDGAGLYLNGNIYVSQTNSTINPTISTSKINNNKAFNRGGGIYCYDCNSTISSTEILNNSASSVDGLGGGMFLQNSYATINGGFISQNVSGNKGGGMAVLGGRMLSINNSALGDNVSSKSGCDLYTDDYAKITMTNVSLNEMFGFYQCATCTLTIK